MQSSFYNYVAIEGNIGAGKTTLSTKLAGHFNARLILEAFEDNPFLPQFYQNPERYAFPTELALLADRYHQLAGIATGPDLFQNMTISDFYLSKSLIFARSTLRGHELDLFKKLYQIMYISLPKPELLVYLWAPVDQLLSNIRKRGRGFEQDIQGEYLNTIQHSYITHFQQTRDIPIVLVDISAVDFLDNDLQFRQMAKIFDRQWINGLQLLKIDDILRL